MKFEVGKSYMTRDGSKATVLFIVPDEYKIHKYEIIQCYVHGTEAMHGYSPEGKYMRNFDSGFDLISEWKGE